VLVSSKVTLIKNKSGLCRFINFGLKEIFAQRYRFFSSQILALKLELRGRNYV
jgi:hypothetical protein